jgi:hypothetical protein
MSSDALPWEDEFTVEQWLAFKPGVGHNTWRDANGVFYAQIALIPRGRGLCRQYAIVQSVRNYCKQTDTPLPFRPRPDLATVEGCMEAFASKATMIVFRGPTALSAGKCPLHVNIQKTANGPSRDFGKPGQPWTLADLQAAARYVLGLEE